LKKYTASLSTVRCGIAQIKNNKVSDQNVFANTSQRDNIFWLFALWRKGNRHQSLLNRRFVVKNECNLRKLERNWKTAKESLGSQNRFTPKEAAKAIPSDFMPAKL